MMTHPQFSPTIRFTTTISNEQFWCKMVSIGIKYKSIITKSIQKNIKKQKVKSNLHKTANNLLIFSANYHHNL